MLGWVSYFFECYLTFRSLFFCQAKDCYNLLDRFSPHRHTNIILCSNVQLCYRMWEQQRGGPKYNKCDQCVSVRTEEEAERLLEAPCGFFQCGELKELHQRCCGGRAEVEPTGRKERIAVWRQTKDTQSSLLSGNSMHT